MSRPNERLSQNDQSNDELASSGDSAVLSPRKEPRRRFTHKEKGKQNISEYETSNVESDQSEFDSRKEEGGSLRTKSEPAKKGPKPGNDKLCRSSRQKNLVKRYGHNKYMAYHYVYITMVAEVGEPERYAKAEKDTNWCAVVKKCVHLMPTKHGTSLTLPVTIDQLDASGCTR